MNDFKQNICRVCKQVFCCIKCRKKHEILKHELFPDCDICLYGKAVISNPSEELTNHLKSAHWPLVCLFCKRLFGSTDELLQHNKCPIGCKETEDIEKSPYTPLQSHMENYESPPLSALLPKGQQDSNKGNMFCNLTTSTPMQRTDENNLLEKMHEVLTPMDCSDINKDSIIKKKQMDSNKSDSLKRKVTFCETPISDSYRKPKGMLTKREPDSTPVTDTSPATFYSLKEEDSLEVVAEKQNDPKETKDIPIIKIHEAGAIEEGKIEEVKNVEVREDTTMWVSASNMSPLDVDREKTSANLHPTTPVAQKTVKVRVRQVNIVMPTPIVKKDDSSIKSDMSDQALSVAEHDTNDTNARSEQNTSSSSTSRLEDNEIENREFFPTSSGTSDDVMLKMPLGAASGVWSSMSRLVRNVTGALPGFSGVEANIFSNCNGSMERSSLEDDALDSPPIKRRKLDIKCRRTIRELPVLEKNRAVHKRRWNSSSQRTKKQFADKATQTEPLPCRRPYFSTSELF